MHNDSNSECRWITCTCIASILTVLIIIMFYIFILIPATVNSYKNRKFQGLTRYLIEKEGMSLVGTWTLFNVLKVQGVKVTLIRSPNKKHEFYDETQKSTGEYPIFGFKTVMLGSKPTSKTGFFLTYKNETQSIKDILHGGCNGGTFYQWIWRFYHNDKVIRCLETFKVDDHDCVSNKDLSQIYSRADDMFIYKIAEETFYYRRKYEMELY